MVPPGIVPTLVATLGEQVMVPLRSVKPTLTTGLTRGLTASGTEQRGHHAMMLSR